jgi:hypothetical protein
VELTTIIQALEGSLLSDWMRNNLKAMPLVEATHVLAIAVVFGTILIVDLRLLGYPSTRRSYTRVHDDLVRWTWAAFGIAVITGVLMFVPNATTYYNNAPFLWKIAVMLGAGVNMAVFELVTARSKASWDQDVAVPNAGRLAGLLSIGLWTGVIVLGRWIGFTKGYNFEIPDDIDLDFLETGGILQVKIAWC